jgi:hypothetical protein
MPTKPAVVPELRMVSRVLVVVPACVCNDRLLGVVAVKLPLVEDTCPMAKVASTENRRAQTSFFMCGGLFDWFIFFTRSNFKSIYLNKLLIFETIIAKSLDLVFSYQKWCHNFGQ